jgi:hypothetical protein
MPQQQGFVGVPMRLVVVFENVQSHVDPTLPEIEGFTIKRLAGEQSSEHTTIINGRMTHSKTRSITFTLTPVETGVFTIPELTFEADGKYFRSNSRTISIEHPPTGGALRVEITGTKDDVFLGQPIDLTMQIFIEAFTDPELGITLDARDMVSLLRGEFGIFKEAIDEGQLKVQEVRGTTDSGVPTTFYVLTVQATTWPETAGPFNMEPISVLMNYPIALKQERGFGFFGSDSLTVDQSHLLSAACGLPEIHVRTPPSKDKPAWYNGAVGTYDIRVIADPTHVKVGEPITLTMRITDRTSGPINLDYLAAPLLDRVPALTDQFRVPDTPLGGSIDGRTKTFTQTIRPRNEHVTELPALPMSSFNPSTNTYQTVWSTPIPLTVKAVATVSADDLVQGSSQHESNTSFTDVEGGILANYTGNDLLNSQQVSMTPLLLGSIFFPPFVFLVIVGVKVFSNLNRNARASVKGQVKHATKSIKHATSLQGKEQIKTISDALRVLQQLQESEPHEDEIQSLLNRCDALQFGGQSDASLVKDATSLVEAIR